MFSLLLFFACGDEEKSDTAAEEVIEVTDPAEEEAVEEEVEIEEESEEEVPEEERGE